MAIGRRQRARRVKSPAKKSKPARAPTKSGAKKKGAKKKGAKAVKKKSVVKAAAKNEPARAAKATAKKAGTKPASESAPEPRPKTVPPPSTRVTRPSTRPPRATQPVRPSTPPPAAMPTARASTRPPQGGDASALWQRLERWFARHTDARLALRPPASRAAIEKAQRALAIELPPAFVASLAVHDGQDDSFAGEWLPEGGRLAPLEAIVTHWQDEQHWVDPDDPDYERVIHAGRFRSVVRHARRIAIGGSSYWDRHNLYLDLIPGPKGTSGQLAQLISECDFALIGRSFDEFLARYVELLENGQLRWQAGAPGRIVRADGEAGLTELFTRSR